MVAEGSAQTGRLLLFSVGPGRFAVRLEDVLGVREPAGDVAFCDRTVQFQGEPVPAVDARWLWRGGASQPAEGCPAVIIVSSEGGPKALMVDRLEGITDGVELRPLPALVARFARSAFSGVTLHADGGRLLIDPAALSGAAAECRQRGPGEA